MERMELIRLDVLAAECGQAEPATPDPDPTTFQVFVRNITGNHITFMVESGCTVERLKFMVRDRVGIHPFQQRLIFGGQQLQDDKTLAFYNIRKDNTIHLTLRLLGGMNTEAYHCAVGGSGTVA
ncbi:ubiquitin [Aphelenchoides avenae]|nr:ubiquitin [Aphelenchus avenae]